jgi:hypothetical protein
MHGAVVQRRTSRRAYRHYGAWRAALATPAVIASTALLLVLFGFLGRWEPVALVGWLALGATAGMRPVEQIIARIGHGFLRPDSEQRILLDAPWRDALARSGRSVGDVDLYVSKRSTANAYAVGKRTVAVTTALLKGVRAGRISNNEMAGVLLHEIGHLVTNATKFGPARTWLSAPWRIAVRATCRVATALAPLTAAAMAARGRCLSGVRRRDRASRRGEALAGRCPIDGADRVYGRRTARRHRNCTVQRIRRRSLCCRCRNGCRARRGDHRP